MDLLLDTDIVFDICKSKFLKFLEKSEQDKLKSRDDFSINTASESIDRCKELGGRIWLYVGSIATLQHKLAKYIMEHFSNQNNSNFQTQIEAKKEAAQIIKMFAKDKHWLAALSPEEDIFDADDLEQSLLIKALNSFEPNSIKLLTWDKNLIEKFDCAILPETYLSSFKSSSVKPIEFIDLKAQQDKIRPKLEQHIHRTLHHGSYIMGPEIAELEKQLADYVGVNHCITASSGTDTLLIAMMALGVGQGDEVITSVFTFIATGEMIALLGAKAVFVDIDARTCNIDAKKVEQAITSRTKAIMPVSLYGQCADFDAINSIAAKYNLPVIEDGAQSFGATYKGRRSCGLSTIGSTSFFPSKPLGGYGDGGALFTNDDALAKVIRQIRVHGQARRYYHKRLGINGRLDTLQAGVLLAKFELFDKEVALRGEVALKYFELLKKYCYDLILPHIEPHNTSVFAQYTVMVKNYPKDDGLTIYRDRLIAEIKNRAVPIAVHYPMPLHLQPIFNKGEQDKDILKCEGVLMYKKGDFPVAESIADRVFSLPMGPYLKLYEQQTIVNRVAEAMAFVK
ncbi:MAG: DegT/DnrJ/EryC1/StrS family aminotransferase [Desulfamplus sp.]|nr:DegT/DnrJ/EryC1/StrS family aminotransferase [Desulfamplus sp.]